MNHRRPSDAGLSRFNPPGQSSLSYRACSYDETLARMRQCLSRVTTDRGDGQPHTPLARLNPEASDDWSIGLLHAWASVLDVLSFYQERIANESFLETATERVSFVEILRTVGYELRPALSARTTLSFTVLDAAGESARSVVVKAGTAVQSIPETNGLPQVFETSTDLVADVAWNNLQVAPPEEDDWSRYLNPDVTQLRLHGEPSGLQAGDPILIVGSQNPATGKSRWRLVRLTSVRLSDDGTQTNLVWEVGADLGRGTTTTDDAGAFRTTLESPLHLHPTTGVYVCGREPESSWQPSGVGLPELPVSQLLKTKSGSWLAATDNGVFRSHHDVVASGVAHGDLWHETAAAIQKKITALTEDPRGDLFAGTDDGEVLRSRDDGRSWQVVSGEPRPPRRWLGKILPILFAAPLPKTAVRSLVGYGSIRSPRLLTGTDDGMFSSANGGRTWRTSNLSVPELSLRDGKASVAAWSVSGIGPVPIRWVRFFFVCFVMLVIDSISIGALTPLIAALDLNLVAKIDGLVAELERQRSSIPKLWSLLKDALMGSVVVLAVMMAVIALGQALLAKVTRKSHRAPGFLAATDRGVYPSQLSGRFWAVVALLTIVLFLSDYTLQQPPKAEWGEVATVTKDVADAEVGEDTAILTEPEVWALKNVPGGASAGADGYRVNLGDDVLADLQCVWLPRGMGSLDARDTEGASDAEEDDSDGCTLVLLCWDPEKRRPDNCRFVVREPDDLSIVEFERFRAIDLPGKLGNAGHGRQLVVRGEQPPQTGAQWAFLVKGKLLVKSGTGRQEGLVQKKVEARDDTEWFSASFAEPFDTRSIEVGRVLYADLFDWICPAIKGFVPTALAPVLAGALAVGVVLALFLPILIILVVAVRFFRQWLIGKLPSALKEPTVAVAGDAHVLLAATAKGVYRAETPRLLTWRVWRLPFYFLFGRSFLRRWKLKLSAEGVRCLFWGGDGSVVVGFNDGRIQRSSDAGESFAETLTGLPLTDVRSILVDDDSVAVAGAPSSDPLEPLWSRRDLAGKSLRLARLHPGARADRWAVITRPGVSKSDKDPVHLLRVASVTESLSGDLIPAGRLTELGVHDSTGLDKFLRPDSHVVVLGASLPVSTAGCLTGTDQLRLTVPVTEAAAGRLVVVTGKRMRCRWSNAWASAEHGYLAEDEEKPSESFQILSRESVGSTGSYRWKLKDGLGRISEQVLPVVSLVFEFARDDDEYVSEVAEIQLCEAPEPGEPGSKLTLAKPLANVYDGSKVSVQGNAVVATHGQTVVDEVLGSSSGAEPNQRYALRQWPVTHLSSPTEDGVVSSVKVSVSGVTWREHPWLFELPSNERAYVMRRDAQNRSFVQFGDGVEGARVPSNREGVLATYRVGAGPGGNVRADSLKVLLHPPAGIEKVTNPVPADGGTPPEAGAWARHRAPKSMRSLERIITVSNFEDFAASFAGIGRARAALLRAGSAPVLHLTIAAMDGAAIAKDSPVRESLVEAIDRMRSAPFPRVVVDSVEPLYFAVALRIVVQSDHLPRREEIEETVRSRVQRLFAFEKRTFGAQVSASSIIAEAQRAVGVDQVILTGLQICDRDSEEGHWEPRRSDALDAQLARERGGQLLPAQMLLLAAHDKAVVIDSGVTR